MRFVLGSILWTLDLILKCALGFLAVFMVWMICSTIMDLAFDLGWIIAGCIVSLCIIGFFEGCDFLLLGLAKRISGDR